MFQDMLDLKNLAQEAMHNPALALRNGLRRIPDKIRKKQEDLEKLRRQLDEVERRTREQERENRRGWFGRTKEPGIFAMIGEGIGGWAEKSTKSSIAQAEAELQGLSELYEELNQPLYPAGKKWTFAEVDQEIIQLFNQLAGAHSTLEQAGSIAVTTVKPQFEAGEDGGLPWGSLMDGFKQLSAASAAMDGMDILLLRMCKLTLELDGLYAARRKLLPTFLREVKAWDKRQITAELQRRNRDLKDLPSESEVLTRQLSNLPVKNLSPEMIKRSPMYAAFGEQRRFLEDVIFELQAAVEHNKTAPKKSDPTADILNQIKELRRKMKAALANETDTDIRDDIKRAYGKKIDALREHL